MTSGSTHGTVGKILVKLFVREWIHGLNHKKILAIPFVGISSLDLGMWGLVMIVRRVAPQELRDCLNLSLAWLAICSNDVSLNVIKRNRFSTRTVERRFLFL